MGELRGNGCEKIEWLINLHDLCLLRHKGIDPL